MSILVPLQDIIPIDTTGLPSLDYLTLYEPSEMHEYREALHVLRGVNPISWIKVAYEMLERSDCLNDARQHFKDNILVDLGAGRNIDGYILANTALAKAYIGVEQYHSNALNTILSDMQYVRERLKCKKLIPASIAAEDMLSFLTRLPDDSVAVLTSGIDLVILSDDDYAKEVDQEIARVLHPDSAYLSFYSNFDPELQAHPKNDSYQKFTKRNNI